MKWREDPTRSDRPRPDADVRPMRADDSGLLKMIRAICLKECLSSHYTQQQIAAWLAADAVQSDAREGEHVLVAEMQGAIAGYAAWSEGELLATFVVPAAQEMGVGTLLVDSCTLDATSLGTPIARVCASLNATGFYRMLGFQPSESGFHEKEGVRIPYQLMVRPTR